jgi:hypothetical protein
MVSYGKHHDSGPCQLAQQRSPGSPAGTGQPYALRDFDGRSMSLAEAKRIVAERYTVPLSATRSAHHWATGRQAAGAMSRRALRRPTRPRDTLPPP